MSVRLLSRSFLGIGSLVFSETKHGVKGPCSVMHDKTGFFKNHIFAHKIGKISQA